jgi:hypothetical protein
LAEKYIKSSQYRFCGSDLCIARDIPHTVLLFFAVVWQALSHVSRATRAALKHRIRNNFNWNYDAV